jgi:prepilin-type N-terminal cleavage/methylation domain-containing protein
MKLKAKRGNKGFTLIELLVVVLIIGILASIAVPQYFRIVEKGRVSEALNYVSAVKGAQERYLMRNQTYSTSLTALDLGAVPTFKHFGAAPTVGASATTFNLIMTRSAANSPYGQYTVIFYSNNGAFNSSNAEAARDLLP